MCNIKDIETRDLMVFSSGKEAVCLQVSSDSFDRKIGFEDASHYREFWFGIDDGIAGGTEYEIVKVIKHD